MAHSSTLSDIQWSSLHHRSAHHPPPSPPAEYDPDSAFPWPSSSGHSISISAQLPLSPLTSPSPDQTAFPNEIESNPLSYPLLRIPSPASSTRSDIHRTNENGEIEMEDAFETESHVYVTDDGSSHDTMDEDEDDEEMDIQPINGGLQAIPSEGLFRAGTPTPLISPPQQIPTPYTDENATEYNLPGNAIEGLGLLSEAGMFDGFAEEIEEFLEMSHEISTEELDTEFLDVRRRNFWNSWLRYRYRKPQQQGIFAVHVGSEWSDLLAFLMESRPAEITEEDFDKGTDIQGLRWGVDDIPTKEDFRERRVKDYGSPIVKPPPPPMTINPAHDPTRIHNFYKFRYTNLKHRCSLHHFQLRYLLSATSKNDLYYIFDNSLRRWDTLQRTSEQIINFKQSRQAPWKGWMPSTLACAHHIAAVGGYSAEYAIIPLSDVGSARIGSLAETPYITNHVDIIEPREGGVSVIWANNDFKIRQQDVESGKFVRVHSLKWPINATATSPDGRIRAAVGDAKEVVLMDATRGEVLAELWGHNHWSFAVDWRNDGYTFVTGNQDMSARYSLPRGGVDCRLWDARYLKESFLTLPAKMGAIRSVHFSPDGKYLAIAEPADYVHIYDATTGLYEEKQTIEFIGETAGVSFDPTGDSLFIGNADDLVGSIYEFGRVNAKECDQSWEDVLL